MGWADLDTAQRLAGAKLVDFQGVLLPRTFTTLAAECRAVRHQVGLLDGRNRRLLSLVGGDRTTFLQGMISNDVAQLAAGRGTYAALLTVQGKLVCDLYVYVLDDRVLLDVPSARQDAVRAALERYIIADDVEFEDLDIEPLLALEGPRAAALLAEVAQARVDDLLQYAHREIVLYGQRLRCVAVAQTGERGFRLCGNPHAVADLWQRLTAAGATPVGLDALDVLRLEAGIPWYGPDMDEDTLVMEIGIEEALSFSKGCYLGQEVVERVAARGHVNRKLCGLDVASSTLPPAGTTLSRDGEEVGAITSAAWSPVLGRIIALGYVHRSAFTPATELKARVGAEEISVTVTERPVYHLPAIADLK